MNTRFARRSALIGLAAGAALLGGASTGVASAQPAHATGAAPSTSAAACTVSSFRVTWEAAGVYKYPDRSGELIKTKHSGDRVTGPTGGTGVNFTQVYVDNTVGYMDKDAVAYTGCA